MSKGENERRSWRSSKGQLLMSLESYFKHFVFTLNTMESHCRLLSKGVTAI